MRHATQNEEEGSRTTGEESAFLIFYSRWFMIQREIHEREEKWCAFKHTSYEKKYRISNFLGMTWRITGLRIRQARSQRITHQTWRCLFITLYKNAFKMRHRKECWVKRKGVLTGLPGNLLLPSRHPSVVKSLTLVYPREGLQVRCWIRDQYVMQKSAVEIWWFQWWFQYESCLRETFLNQCRSPSVMHCFNRNTLEKKHKLVSSLI